MAQVNRFLPAIVLLAQPFGIAHMALGHLHGPVKTSRAVGAPTNLPINEPNGGFSK